MSLEKRDTHAVAGVAEDATEVLPFQAYSQVVAPADGDETVVLPARSASGSWEADATLPLSRVEADQATVALPVQDATTPLASSPYVSSGVSKDSAPQAQVVPPAQRLADVRDKLQRGTATGAAAAKNGFAVASTRAKEAAARVKQERAARATQKMQKATEPPLAQPVSHLYSAQQANAPYPTSYPAQHNSPVTPAPYGGSSLKPALLFGGATSNTYRPQTSPATQPVPDGSAHSPSGRLQMLTPSHIRQTRPSLWTLIQHFFAAGSLGLMLVFTFAFFIYSELGQRLDEISYQEFTYRFMTYTPQTSSLLDTIPTAAGIIAAVGVLFVLIWKHRFVPALVGVGMAIGANATTQLLKNFFIVKPNLGVQEVISNSAPSGHTTFAAAAGLALFLASPKRFRPTVALLSMVFTIAAGYSTIVNAWHRPADVVSAILVTGLWGIFGLVLLRFMRSEELDMSNTQRSGLILVPLLSITGFFMGFCALALYAVTHHNPIPGSAFIAGLCLVGSVACITTSVLVALLRPQNKQRSPYRRVWAY